MPDEPPSEQQAPILFSVATVTYNAATLLERTIRNVEAQSYPFIEHLIIDGNSSDDTLTRLHEYQKRNSLRDTPISIEALSENDNGIYDAMNKALRLAQGDYIIFMNAGDKFHTPDVLQRVAEAAQAERRRTGSLPAVLYGLTHLVDDSGRFVRERRLSPPAAGLDWRSFAQGMLVCHQAFFAHTKIARPIAYDEQYRLSADFDWCIRIMQAAQRESRSIVNAHTIVADYLNEGATTRHRLRSLRERFRIMAHHYGLGATLRRHIGFVFRLIGR